VRELLKRAGVEGTVKVGLWDAGYGAAQANANACVFATARVESREKLFRWFGPIAQNTWVLYALPSFDKKIATTRDARHGT
jgi:polar amino acid transport system substrate-binding protein